MQWEARIKYYLWASFQKIWSLSKSSKSDIKMAISARKIKIWKQFFHEKKHYIVVVYVPSFYPSARPSSFFLVFFLHFYGKLFLRQSLFDDSSSQSFGDSLNQSLDHSLNQSFDDSLNKPFVCVTNHSSFPSLLN